MKQSSVKKLLAIYDAIGGMISEMPDPFDGFYKGGTDKLCADFESVLKECGVQFAEQVPGQYFVASYKSKMGSKPEKRWGICTDENHIEESWCLTGFATPEEAIATINDKNIFDDYNGKPIKIINRV